MNWYTLLRDYHNFCFENPEYISPTHWAIYSFFLDQRNRFGQKEKFSFPAYYCMECIGVKNYKTYKKAFDDLVVWGFIKIVQKSQNQHTACIVGMVKNTKASTKALDKANTKASPDHCRYTATINKQTNKWTNEQTNEENIFNSFTFIDEDVKSIFIEFVNRRKKNEKNFEDSIITRLYNKLNKLSNNKAEQIEIIEKSLVSNWKDFFQLKWVQYKQPTIQEQKSKFTTEADAEKLLFAMHNKWI